ncbi:MAG: glycosyltransferase family 2 protein, partial [Bdellovibrionales bacterium]|nr:glycosyltransferase family 2 protein [Bdellovibrionales bacterium]
MEVSVIVLSYNHPEITARTLSSLKSFEFKSTLLVHNGSTPMHQESLQTNFPNIEHLVLPTNLGFSGGANAGLTEAFKTADWCLFLTNDCVLETIGVLPTKPSIVAPKIWSRNTDRIDSLGGYFVPHKGLLQHIRNEEDFYTNSDLKYVPGTAFLLHKDIFSKTAGFDPSL